MFPTTQAETSETLTSSLFRFQSVVVSFFVSVSCCCCSVHQPFILLEFLRVLLIISFALTCWGAAWSSGHSARAPADTFALQSAAIRCSAHRHTSGQIAATILWEEFRQVCMKYMINGLNLKWPASRWAEPMTPNNQCVQIMRGINKRATLSLHLYALWGTMDPVTVKYGSVHGFKCACYISSVFKFAKGVKNLQIKALLVPTRV